MEFRVIVVDVGSVNATKFGWAAFDQSGREPVGTGHDPESCVTARRAIAKPLQAGLPTALLLEAPMAIPVPPVATSWRRLGKARAGEGNRPWSAGAGAGALATALAQGSWILTQIAEHNPTVKATSQITTWLNRRAQLLLAEAFVSGTGKAVPVAPELGHVADASAAAVEFVRRTTSRFPVSDVRCEPDGSLNLLATMSMWAGVPIDTVELRQDVLVVKVEPVPLRAKIPPFKH